MKMLFRFMVLFILMSCHYLYASCQLLSGSTIEYSVNMSSNNFTLDITNSPVGTLLYTYGGMTITNNATWDINCNGNEPSGYKSFSGARVSSAYNSKPGDIFSIPGLPGIGYSFQMGEQDGVDFDSLFYEYPNASPFSGERTFSAESKKPTLYFWRIPDSSGLPPPGQYCFNSYLGDIYLDNVDAVRFSVSGLCITVKAPTCTVMDISKNITVNMGTHNKTSFSGVGSTTSEVPFTISLSNCQSVGSVFMQFNATVDTDYSGGDQIIHIDNSPNSATGVGIQILDSNNNPVTLNNPSQIWSGSKGSQTAYNFQYYARYFQTLSSVSAGEANAVATYVLTYN
ncbi:TPA: fimbrial protein [Klebsiella quasipneumoniae subsp. similipneumoniae]|nr:fimbrial protein [Klebsiella quasipneumoniae subsp. similipneumoniae]HCQ8820010.1 fimbrial protein [Klebsiella pneumoniae]